jgi:hypothetical protein
MAKYIADVNGNLTEVLPLEAATVPYPTADATTTARNNATDANKMIELTSQGVIHKDFLPYRFITVGGTPGHAGMSAILDGSGKWHMSLMPVGVGAEVVIGNASEALTAGNLCNIHAVSTALAIRRASASALATNANGFVLASFASGASSTMYGVSNEITGLSGLTIGSQYYLSTTAGAMATSAPTADNNIVQRIGRAHSVSAIIFSNSEFLYVKKTT